MSSALSLCDEARRLCLDAGACAVGITGADDMEPADIAAYERWIASGAHGAMDYLSRYPEVRRSPRLLLEGAKSIVVCAFAYTPTTRHPLIADYALGEDYHDVLRRALTPVAEALQAMVPHSATRICVDTAPLRERLIAVRAGVGFIGRNMQLIVPGVGSRVFLAEILWTAALEPDMPCEQTCCGCGACVSACPGHALDCADAIDARRCLSYLTIEYRGDLAPDVRLPGRIYGCDICQDVCPHNRDTRPAAVLPAFRPNEELMDLDAEAMAQLSAEDFRRIFRRSAIRRAKAEGLRRNALRHLLKGGTKGEQRH